MLLSVKCLIYKLCKLTSPALVQKARHGNILCDPSWTQRQADHGASLYLSTWAPIGGTVWERFWKCGLPGGSASLGVGFVSIWFSVLYPATPLSPPLCFVFVVED